MPDDDGQVQLGGRILWLWSKVHINDAELVFRDTDGGIVTGVDDRISILIDLKSEVAE